MQIAINAKQSSALPGAAPRFPQKCPSPGKEVFGRRRLLGKPRCWLSIPLLSGCGQKPRGGTGSREAKLLRVSGTLGEVFPHFHFTWSAVTSPRELRRPLPVAGQLHSGTALPRTEREDPERSEAGRALPTPRVQGARSPPSPPAAPCAGRFLQHQGPKPLCPPWRPIHPRARRRGRAWGCHCPAPWFETAL